MLLEESCWLQDPWMNSDGLEPLPVQSTFVHITEEDIMCALRSRDVAFTIMKVGTLTILHCYSWFRDTSLESLRPKLGIGGCNHGCGQAQD